MPNELDNEINKFVSLCQKNPISREIIKSFEPYYLDKLRFVLNTHKVYNKNIIYSDISMNGHDYIFRYKDEQTIIDITCSYPQIKYSFDYDENESCININGHLLKYVVIDKYDRKCIYTFDAYSHKELLITFDNPIINNTYGYV